MKRGIDKNLDEAQLSGFVKLTNYSPISPIRRYECGDGYAGGVCKQFRNLHQKC
jgi:hypothetical protein